MNRILINFYSFAVAMLMLGSAAPAFALTFACKDAWQKVGKTEETFKSNYLDKSSGADNRDFIANQKDCKLFFFVENAVLKQLTDKIFEDSEVSGAIKGLYTELLWKNILKDRTLLSRLRYSDYKTSRFGFSEDTALVRRQLREAYNRTAIEFKQTMESNPELRAKWEVHQRNYIANQLKDLQTETNPEKRLAILRKVNLAGDPALWHLAGIGKTADQAGVMARLARYSVGPEKKLMPVFDFQDPEHQKELVSRVRESERLRALIQNQIDYLGGLNSGLLDRLPTLKAKYVLSEQALNILQHVPASNKEEYIKYLQDHFEMRFHLRLHPSLIEEIQRYAHFVDTFSPAILEEEETTNLGLDKAHHGAIRVDQSGQNSRNAIALMSALSLVSRLKQRDEDLAYTLTRTLNVVRAAQNRASNGFRLRQEFPATAAARAELKGDTSIWPNNGTKSSGDDFIFIPEGELNRAQKLSFLSHLVDLAQTHFRVSMIPGNYSNGNAIPPKERGKLVNHGESLEKELMKALESPTLPYEKLQRTIFAFDLVPHRDGRVEVSVLVGSKTLEPGLLEVVREKLGALLPEGYTLKDVVSVPSVTSLAR